MVDGLHIYIHKNRTMKLLIIALSGAGKGRVVGAMVDNGDNLTKCTM
jgi:hypothetical protein